MKKNRRKIIQNKKKENKILEREIKIQKNRKIM